jgi:hypothetical protein
MDDKSGSRCMMVMSYNLHEGNEENYGTYQQRRSSGRNLNAGRPKYDAELPTNRSWRLGTTITKTAILD